MFVTNALKTIHMTAPVAQDENTWIGPGYCVRRDPLKGGASGITILGPPFSRAVETRRLLSKVLQKKDQLSPSMPGFIFIELSRNHGLVDPLIVSSLLEASGGDPGFEHLVAVVLWSEYLDGRPGGVIAGRILANDKMGFASNVEVSHCLGDIQQWLQEDIIS